jgi:hypothetical protein
MRLPLWLSPSRRAERRKARRQQRIMLEMLAELNEMAGIGPAAKEVAR